jgi:hypothetical protein
MPFFKALSVRSKKIFFSEEKKQKTFASLSRFYTAALGAPG